MTTLQPTSPGAHRHACPFLGRRLPPEVSIIVPTLNEAESLPELLRRIDAALRGRHYEVVIVDDGSQDATPEVWAGLAQRYPVTLHVRDNPAGGLSGAVVHGMGIARGETFIVMDADLQHPPEVLPELLAALDRGEAEFVIGSRHVDGGSTADRWGWVRRINSAVATLLARPFAGNTRDPMSGFFALRRQTFAQARRLTPLGYKIGLELMCKCQVRRIKEVPIHFDTRRAGKSKLSLAQQFRYLDHLSRLYDFCYPRVAPGMKFLFATGYGWFMGLAVFGVLLLSGANPFIAAPAAYPAAIGSAAVFHVRTLRARRDVLAARHPWRDFSVISLAEWGSCTLTAWWMAGRLRETSALEVFLITFGVATVLRYVLRKEVMLDIRGLRRVFRPDEF